MTLDPTESESRDETSESNQDSPFDETLCISDTDSGNAGTSGLMRQDWIGRTLGKYQITGLLGQGGMGVVLKAHDPGIDRDVAIKVLPENFAANNNLLNRFRAEAKAAGKLNSAHVTSIYEIGQEGETNYLVMELLTGGSIADELEKRGVLSPLEATTILIDACQGIAAAHAAGLIHRDIKPANLIRAEDRSVKLTDFGLAKFSTSIDRSAIQLTQAGTVIGTPSYMSPEQCQGQKVDNRSDIYGLGATYYSLLSGHMPFEDSGGVMQVMFAHCNDRIPDPRELNPSVPSACSDIVARAMAKDPADRYQSAEEMIADLKAISSTLSGETRIELPSQSGATFPAIKSTSEAPQVISRKRLMFGIIGSMLILTIVFLLIRPNWMGPLSKSVIPVVPQGEPIKVGVLQSLSGTMSTSGTSVLDATLLAIDEINESGGLLGRPLMPIVADGRSDSKTYAIEAERLLSEEDVCTVFGCWTSANRKTVKPIFEQYDNLLVYPVQYEGMETSPNIVYLGATPNQQIIPAILWANEELEKKRFFIVGSDYVFPRAAAEVIKDQLQVLDSTLVGEMYVPLASAEFAPVVKGILEAKPDLIINMIAGDSNIAFFQTLREEGITPNDIPCLSFCVGEHELRRLNLSEMVGNFAAFTYFQSLDSKLNIAFVERFTKKYPQHVVSDPMEAAYVGVHLWAQAVREAESIEPKKIRRALLNQRMDSPEGHIRIDPDTQHCFKTPRVGLIQNDGQFQIVWSADEPVSPEPYPDTRSAEDWKAFLHDLYTGWGNQWASPNKK